MTPPSATPPPLRWTVALALAAAAPLLVFAGFPGIANALGLGLQDGWFIDLHALLAAGEAHLRGLDVHTLNPLDIYGRPHSYPSVWLALGSLGLTRADTLWLGTTLVGLALAGGVTIVRPRSCGEWACAALWLTSPAVQLGFVRANNDLVVFLVLAPLIGCLVAERRALRIAAAVPVAAAALLKYYPAAAALLLLHERERRVFFVRAALMLGLAAVVVFSVWEDTRHFATALPAPAGLFSFGATQSLLLLGLDGELKWFALAALIFIGWRRSRSSGGGAPTLAELQFVLGGVLLVACFWAGMSWSYRWIFAVWLFPLLLRSESATLLTARARRVVLWLLPFCGWWDGLGSLLWNTGLGPRLGVALDRFSNAWWLVGQPAVWTLVALLTVACVRFAFAQLSTLRA